MLAKLRTFTLLGIDAIPVEVEVDAARAASRSLLGDICVRLSSLGSCDAELGSDLRAGGSMETTRCGTTDARPTSLSDADVGPSFATGRAWGVGLKSSVSGRSPIVGPSPL